MKIDILTLFPEMFAGPFNESIVKRAIDSKTLELNIHNLRNWSIDKYKTVDDRPFGGGAGMIMRVDVIDRAVNQLKVKSGLKKSKVILLDTKGEIFNQRKAVSLSKLKHLILIAGHYEGLDHRIHEHIADEVISIGEYVLTGGEIPVMVVVDSLARLLPGVIKEESLKEESYYEAGKQEYPQYTRPAEYKGWKVPEVLLSGNHKEIEKWRKGE
jgi:tRNA (guanine37-N1)-methyltransferase